MGSELPNANMIDELLGLVESDADRIFKKFHRRGRNIAIYLSESLWVG